MAHRRTAKIASGVAILFQVTQGSAFGMIVGAVAQQSVSDNSALDPPLVAAYGAIGALFSLYVWSTKGRTERCEGREDKWLATDAEKNITMRDLANATTKNAEVTAQLVASQSMQIEEMRRDGTKIDALAQQVTALQLAVAHPERKAQS